MTQVYLLLVEGFIATMGSIALDLYCETVREQETRDLLRLPPSNWMAPPREKLLPVEWSHGRAARRVPLQRDKPRELVRSA